MSNKTATLSMKLTFDGLGGQSVTPPSIVVAAPFQALSTGIIDVPDTEASATVHAIPFGSIGTGATLALFVNKTGQDLALKVNGEGASPVKIPANGAVCFACAALSAVPVTALSLATTATQSGQGSIEFYLMGDPV